MRTLALIIISFTLTACNRINNGQKANIIQSESINEIPSASGVKTNDSMPSDIGLTNDLDDNLILNGVLGLLVCNNVYDSIKIYNDNRTVFAQFTFKGEESNEFYDRLDKEVKQFELESYKPDYGLLIFPASPRGTLYEIYLLNKTPKYIPASDKNFKFYTWEDFLLSDAYVSINDDTLMSVNNVVYETKDTISKTINFKRQDNEMYFVKGITIDNEWLRVSCEYENGDKNYGWMRWRNENEFLLSFYYLI